VGVIVLWRVHDPGVVLDWCTGLQSFVGKMLEICFYFNFERHRFVFIDLLCNYIGQCVDFTNFPPF